MRLMLPACAVLFIEKAIPVGIVHGATLNMLDRNKPFRYTSGMTE